MEPNEEIQEIIESPELIDAKLHLSEFKKMEETYLSNEPFVVPAIVTDKIKELEDKIIQLTPKEG